MTDENLGEFKKAIDIVSDKEHIKAAINRLWSVIGFIITECPSCKSQQKVQTTKSTKCHRCGRRYRIYPSDKKSRVVFCPKGKLWLLHELRSLETRGKYTAIL